MRGNGSSEPAGRATVSDDEHLIACRLRIPTHEAKPAPRDDDAEVPLRACSCAFAYAGRMTTLVLTGVREYRWIMSWLSRPTQPLVMPVPIVSGSLLA